MLAQRLRRWPNIKTTLFQYIVLLGCILSRTDREYRCYKNTVCRFISQIEPPNNIWDILPETVNARVAILRYWRKPQPFANSDYIGIVFKSKRFNNIQCNSCRLQSAYRVANSVSGGRIRDDGMTGVTVRRSTNVPHPHLSQIINIPKIQPIHSLHYVLLQYILCSGFSAVISSFQRYYPIQTKFCERFECFG